MWVFTQEIGAVAQFEKARANCSKKNLDNAPIYWCRDVDGKPHINSAVMKELDTVENLCQQAKGYAHFLGVVKHMLIVDPKQRAYSYTNVCTVSSSA